jgi:hypothetical protein
LGAGHDGGSLTTKKPHLNVVTTHAFSIYGCMNLPVVLYVVKMAHRHRANGVTRPGQTPFGFPACRGPTGSCLAEQSQPSVIIPMTERHSAKGSPPDLCARGFNPRRVVPRVAFVRAKGY